MTAQPFDTFSQKFFDLIHAGDTVLDLGAGVGKYAQYMAEHGAHVIAVDQRTDVPTIAGVTRVTENIPVWIAASADETYDAILMKNIVQFFSRDYLTQTLFPAIASRVRNGGVVGIQTFFAAPEPPFSKPLTFWTTVELQHAFMGWEVLYSNTFSENRKALSGGDHLFHMTDLIVKKIIGYDRQSLTISP